MSSELKLKTTRERFQYGKYLYRLNVALFEDDAKLGFFDSTKYLIAINKVFYFDSDINNLKNVLRHEIGHLMCHIIYGNTISHHGVEFREFCKKYGWGEEVYAAKANYDRSHFEELRKRPEQKLNLDDQKMVEEQRIIEKIKKLFNLAQSDNDHEAELATLKANELLIKYNLDQYITNTQNDPDDEKIYCKKILTYAKYNRKIGTIISILKTFLVYPVRSGNRANSFLEVAGSKVNIELSEFVANFLDQHLDKLWESARKKNPTLKGSVARNSFMVGVEKGYLQKIELQKKQHPTNQKYALTVLENNLNSKIGMIYPHLVSVRSGSFKFSKDAEKLGFIQGKNLSFNLPIGNQAKAGKKLELTL